MSKKAPARRGTFLISSGTIIRRPKNTQSWERMRISLPLVGHSCHIRFPGLGMCRCNNLSES